jgi:hypothetical protein
MKMETLRRLPAWAKAAAALAVAYIAVFQIPTIWMTAEWLWQCIRSASVVGIVTGLLAVLLAVVHLGIWMLSSYLTGVTYHRTKKKAYAFLLAYLLLCTVTAPVSYFAQKAAYARWQNQIAAMSDEQRREALQHPVRRPQVAYAKRDLTFPVGPMLLLLAIWFMYRAEGMRLANKPGETTSHG